MNLVFDKSFSKALSKIKDKTILKRIETTILSCEEASGIKELRNIKKLSSFNSFYRIKIGEYRIGIAL